MSFLQSAPKTNETHDDCPQDNEIQEVECFDADDDGQVVFTFRQAETTALEVTATEVSDGLP